MSLPNPNEHMRAPQYSKKGQVYHSITIIATSPFSVKIEFVCQDSMAAYKPTAVLVQLGDGRWLTFEHEDIMSLNAGALLKALKKDEAFEVELRDVALSKCVVKVCASASPKKPSVEEETEAGEAGKLEGAATLRDIVTDMVTAGRPYLCIRVELPAEGELKTRPRFEPWNVKRCLSCLHSRRARCW